MYSADLFLDQNGHDHHDQRDLIITPGLIECVPMRMIRDGYPVLSPWQVQTL